MSECAVLSHVAREFICKIVERSERLREIKRLLSVVNDNLSSHPEKFKETLEMEGNQEKLQALTVSLFGDKLTYSPEQRIEMKVFSIKF